MHTMKLIIIKFNLFYIKGNKYAVIKGMNKYMYTSKYKGPSYKSTNVSDKIRAIYTDGAKISINN